MQGVHAKHFTFNRTHQFSSNCYGQFSYGRCFRIWLFSYQWQNWPTATNNPSSERDTPTKENSLISCYLRLQINVIVGGAARRPFFRSPFVEKLKKSKASAIFRIDYCYEEARELNSFRYIKERVKNEVWKFVVFEPHIKFFALFSLE